MDYKKEIQFLKSDDPYSLLVVSFSGYITRLYCPFKVICIKSNKHFNIGDFGSVDMVEKENIQSDIFNREVIIFIINDNKFCYRDFKLI
jgi:hypothetical protein